MKLHCPVGPDGEGCGDFITVEIDGPDRSVGIMGYTIVSVSGSCAHVDALNALLEGPHEGKHCAPEVAALYAQVDEYEEPEESDEPRTRL